jgi:arylsulfatase A-like enzyme
MYRAHILSAAYTLLATLGFSIGLPGFGSVGQQPNVIVIISDDQGWADIGYNNAKVYTPNLDQLAQAGAIFTNHYVMPQCTPTRVAVMTGRYPGRFGPQAQQANNVPAFPLGTPTMASMFQQSGYATYLVGKWHLGSKPEHGPNHFGFDHSYGSLSGAVGMYDHRYREGEFENSWHRDLKPIDGHENGTHTTDLFAREAVHIIEQKREQPFFLYLAFNAVHTPLDERGPFVDQPTQLDPKNLQRWLNEDKIHWFHDPAGKIQSETDPEKRLFLAATYHMDDAIGLVVQALKRTGQLENTLILYSSDNGPQVNWAGDAYPDDLKLTDFNQPLPMRGKKIDVWEGGIHVPAFAYWSGHIKSQKIADPVHIIDWFPTLASLLNDQPKESIAWDGVDLTGLIFDQQSLKKRDLYWIWNQRANRWALQYGDWKIVKYGRPEPKQPPAWQLYNLKDDPKEQQNVATAHPEIVAQLHQLFQAQRSKDRPKFVP